MAMTSFVDNQQYSARRFLLRNSSVIVVSLFRTEDGHQVLPEPLADRALSRHPRVRDQGVFGTPS